MEKHKAFACFFCWHQMEIPTLNMKLYHKDGNFPKAKLISILFINVQCTRHQGYLMKLSTHSRQLSSTQCKRICSFTTGSSLVLFFHSMLPTQGCLKATQYHMELESVANEKSLFFLYNTSRSTCPINMLKIPPSKLTNLQYIKH